MTSHKGLSRRDFLKVGGATGATASLAASAADDAHKSNFIRGFSESLVEKPISELQQMMANGELSAETLTRFYLARIANIDNFKALDSIIQTNPEALDIARSLDQERADGTVRGPLHGIPIVVKDNIDTGDQMMTTAGSLALVGDPASQDATVVSRLRDAGAIILGKANLSEWANLKGFNSSSGWSAVGGIVSNPYVMDRNACGSSSGTGAAVSASLCAAGLGTETDGSVVCPAAACGVVGIKPTVGLTSRAGVVPISATQDSVGIHGRTVADAAALLGPMTGVDPRDPASDASAGNYFGDYSQFVDPDGIAGARIGVARQFDASLPANMITAYEGALQAMRDAGAELVDVAFDNFDEFNADSSEVIVLVYEYKRDLNAYLATRSGVPVSNMADVIAFNLANAEAELKWFGQEWFLFSEGELFSEQQYLDALARGPRLAGPEGIDKVLADFGVEAIITPTNSPAWPSDLVSGDAFQFGTSSYAAVAGYPLVTVPMGDVFGLPVGMTFMGAAYSEATLIRLAAGFEAATQARIVPEFKASLPRKFRIPEFKRRPATLETELARHKHQLEALLKPRVPRPFYL